MTPQQKSNTTLTGFGLLNHTVNLTLHFIDKKASKGELDDIEAGFFASGDDLLIQAAVQRTQPIPRNTSTCVHSGAQISVKGKADSSCFAALSRARDCMLSGIISKEIDELVD
ncbi:hypothetical protein [Xenorhabdus miraniensis]|uniref:hypothetical protein n=1 Tax=Xenorhabdus miraniensis TaxID=351674 RepID=UPI000C04620B|nr:hypothetical protein [Xenorhabdus miraniensis]